MRVRLKKYDGRRIHVKATIADYSKRPWQRSLLSTTLLANVTVNGEAICDHLWVEGRYPEEWRRKKVQFSAKVIPYRRRDHSLDYKLIQLGDVKVIGEGDL